MSWLDLHMHTVLSNDGEFEPDKLMKLCAKAKLEVVAIADHNSTRAYRKASETARDLGIELLPAVELDCTFQGKDFHVLGYGINPEYEEYEIIEKELLCKEQNASKIRLKLMQEAGVKVDHEKAETLAHDGVITGEVIAETALQDSRNYELLEAYLPGGSRSDNPYVNFYWDWCAQGKRAYVPIEFISLDKAIEIIKKSGGIPVLAHPGNNVKEDTDLLEKITERGVCGIEVFSSYHTDKQKKFYMDWAKKHEMVMTAGSDFHGKTKPAIFLGDMDIWGMEEILYKKLKEAIRRG